GADRNELYTNADALQRKMAALPQLLDVTSDLQTRNPQLNAEIDRDKASSLGISAQQIEDALNDAYGTRQISTIYATSNEYQVILEVKPEYQLDPSSLGQLYIHSTASAASASQVAQVQGALAQPSPTMVNSAQAPVGLTAPGQTTTGRLVPLSTVATFSPGIGPLLVNHLSQLPSATISFNLHDGVSLSAATDEVS